MSVVRSHSNDGNSDANSIVPDTQVKITILTMIIDNVGNDDDSDDAV